MTDEPKITLKVKVDNILQMISNKVTTWSNTPSNDNYPSEKLVKDSLDEKINKSNTNGLIKNDGTVDTTSYSTFDGNYNNLSNKPTIPSNTSDLINDNDKLCMYQTINPLIDEGDNRTILFEDYNFDLMFTINPNIEDDNCQGIIFIGDFYEDHIEILYENRMINFTLPYHDDITGEDTVSFAYELNMESENIIKVYQDIINGIIIDFNNILIPSSDILPPMVIDSTITKIMFVQSDSGTISDVKARKCTQIITKENFGSIISIEDIDLFDVLDCVNTILYAPLLDGTETLYTIPYEANGSSINFQPTITDNQLQDGAGYLSDGWDNTVNWELTFEYYTTGDNNGYTVIPFGTDKRDYNGIQQWYNRQLNFYVNGDKPSGYLSNASLSLNTWMNVKITKEDYVWKVYYNDVLKTSFDLSSYSSIVDDWTTMCIGVDKNYNRNSARIRNIKVVEI